jgi:hypothetical protein
LTSSGRGVKPTVPIRAERSAEGVPNNARRVTIEDCRKILGHDCRLNVSELESLLDHLYALANVCIDAFAERQELMGKGENQESSRVDSFTSARHEAIGTPEAAQ